MTNKIIKKNLKQKRDFCLSVLNSISNIDIYLKNILENLSEFNIENYKQQLEIEILENLKEWWTNSNKGIKKDEELFAILFEYDSFFEKNVEASAYGIGEWKDYQVHTNKFSMGFDYDFTTEFYACPGITVNFFDSLEDLHYSKLPEKYSNNHLNFDDLKEGDIIEVDDYNDIEDLEGYNELIELHKCEGMLAIHDVLVKLNKQKEFEILNYRNNFMFLIDEHDSGEVYPLLIKTK